MLALGAPTMVVFAALLLFATAMILIRTFSLVRHAKTLVADTRRAAERLSQAAEEIEAEVRTMSETTEDIKATRNARASGRRRRV